VSARAVDRAEFDARAVRGTSSSVMAMVLFVASETMFFIAFFGIYAAVYSQQPAWPPLKIPLPDMGLPTAGVIVMAVSVIPMALVVRSVRTRGGAGVTKWLVATLVLGVAFCVLQIAGYSSLGFGINDGIYASLFYLMNGLGLAHVIGGVVFLVMVSQQAAAGELALRRDPAEALAVYWLFVVALTIALYVAFFAAVS
jgi:heme/copper-type cytochrome/quinol oxidase subunit 3